jgi:hypothetical protein
MNPKQMLWAMFFSAVAGLAVSSRRGHAWA